MDQLQDKKTTPLVDDLQHLEKGIELIKRSIKNFPVLEDFLDLLPLISLVLQGKTISEISNFEMLEEEIDFLLNQTEIMVENFEKQKKEKCKYCNFSFENDEILEEHVNKYHPNCDYCVGIIISTDPEDLFSCDYCNKTLCDFCIDKFDYSFYKCEECLFVCCYYHGYDSGSCKNKNGPCKNCGGGWKNFKIINIIYYNNI